MTPFVSALRSVRCAGVVGALVLSASVAPLAHADLVVAFADAPVTVIRGATLSRAGEGTRLVDDDIVETGAGKSAQLEDGHGVLIALGPETDVLITHAGPGREPRTKPFRVTMLSGWLKITRTVSRAPDQPPLSVEIPGMDLAPASDMPWSAIVTADSTHEAAYAELGNGTLTFLARPCAVAHPLTLAAGQFAQRAASDCPHVEPRPPAAFVGGMPVGFRDTLVAVSARIRNRHELPAPIRPVDYADVSAWLTSTVSERGTFVKRFAPRLKTPAFHAQLDAHLSSLPEWRPILHPPPRPAEANAHRTHAPPAPGGRDAGIHYRDKPSPDDSEDAH